MNGEKLDLTFISASSEYSASYTAKRALDDSLDTYWRTGAYPTYPQYIVVELNDFYRICGFRIFVGTSNYRPSSFEILVSTDGLDFTEIYSNDCPSSSEFLEFEFPNTLSSKFAKIGFTGASSNRMYLFEFELYGELSGAEEPDEPSSVTKHYYNGVLLPEIPSDVLAEYPYCWLNSDSTMLYVGSCGWYFEKYMYLASSSTHKIYKLSQTGDEWVLYQSYTDTGGYYGPPAWSSHDVPNNSITSTDIYFYGSEPIPEGGSEPDEPDFEPEYSTKYLLKSEDMLCTVIDNELVLLDATELTAEFFHNHGFDELPNWSIISTLTNPEILYWQSADIEDELPTITATMTAIPYPQTIISQNYDMSDDTILGVECAYVTASSDVVFAISVDDGASWYMWTGSAWGTLTDATTGMTAETINAITTEQWAGLMTTGQFKVRATLFDENSSFTSFVMDYIN